MAKVAASLAVLTLLLAGAPAKADTVVTRCRSDREAGSGGHNLADAIKAGGMVTFACGDNATIQISAPHDIERDVVIDGGLKVALREGGGSMFAPRSGTAFELRNVKVNGAKSTVVVVAESTTTGSATISGSVFEDCDKPLDIGGASLTIKDSVFTNNTGSVVMAGGTLTIERSRFLGNRGIAVFNFGLGSSTKVTDSIFTGNILGALLVGLGRASNASHRLEIVRGEFSNNGRTDFEPTVFGNAFGAVMLSCNLSATNCSADISGAKFSGNTANNGGALQFSGAAAVSLKDVRFDGNSAKGDGGAVFSDPKSAPDPKFELQFAVFKDNRARQGGAVRILSSRLNAQKVTFSKNAATDFGGAISAVGATVQVTRGVFVDNVAVFGGAVHLVSAGNSVFANTLMARNRTSSGGAFSGINAAFINVTIADNVGFGIHTEDRAITLRNTVLSNNSAGNCRLDPLISIAPRTLDAGNNLEFPARSCSTSIAVADPSLDTLYIPVFGGAATGTGDNDTCLKPPVSARDVYGKRRPLGISCSIGAAEGDLEKEIADRTVGGLKWPGGLGQGAESKTGRYPGRSCCCCGR